MKPLSLLFVFGIALGFSPSPVSGEEIPWKMHTIDASSRGADGVRLGDCNQDGRFDIATGWEEGGEIRVCFQPEIERIKQPWPSVCVGKVKSPEDAFFADVNGDGRLDVISCCEGKEQTVYAHLAPSDQADLMNSSSWKTVAIKASLGKTRWMFGIPVNLDDDPELELLCGSKNPNGCLGWFDLVPGQSIAEAKWHNVSQTGWIMTLDVLDIDNDGDNDLIYSDRKGSRSGCWLRRNPGDGSTPKNWEEILLGGRGEEVMFLSATKSESTNEWTLICPIRESGFNLLETHFGSGTESNSERITARHIEFPPHVGAGKAARLADINLDGQLEIVATCGLAGNKHGVYWIPVDGGTNREDLSPHTISGVKPGIKYDLLELRDLDNDGDLDLITCEERDNLGVIWYENPAR